MVRGHGGVVEDILPVAVFGIVLQYVAESDAGGQVVLHLVVEAGVLELLAVQPVTQVLDHLDAGFPVRAVGGILGQVFRDGRQAGPRGGLVQLPAVGGPVQAVDAHEAGVAREGALRVFLDEFGEIGFRGIVVLVAVVGQGPVIADRVVPFGPVGQDGHRLEELAGLEVFAVVEQLHRGLVFGVHVVGREQGLELGLAGRHGGQGREAEDNRFEFHVHDSVIQISSRNFSASRAAAHPDAAAVMAWR